MTDSRQQNSTITANARLASVSEGRPRSQRALRCSLPSSQTVRLARLARQLGPGSISVIIDNASQLSPLQLFHEKAGFPAGAFLEMDTGYHCAGLPPNVLNNGGLIHKLLDCQAQGSVRVLGLYSHSSLSYSNSTSAEAISSLLMEVNGCVDALKRHRALFPADHPLVISVGASPQVTVIQNLIGASTPEAIALRENISSLSAENFEGVQVSLEFHAGVYSVMDMQQLSTRSIDGLGLFYDEIALSVVAEVVSVYNDGEREKPEVLISAGTLALGREPCQSYPGW